MKNLIKGATIFGMGIGLMFGSLIEHKEVGLIYAIICLIVGGVIRYKE